MAAIAHSGVELRHRAVHRARARVALLGDQFSGKSVLAARFCGSGWAAGAPSAASHGKYSMTTTAEIRAVVLPTEAGAVPLGATVQQVEAIIIDFPGGGVYHQRDDRPTPVLDSADCFLVVRVDARWAPRARRQRV